MSPAMAAWRRRSAVECGGLGSPLGSLRATEGGESGAIEKNSATSGAGRHHDIWRGFHYADCGSHIYLYRNFPFAASSLPHTGIPSLPDIPIESRFEGCGSNPVRVYLLPDPVRSCGQVGEKFKVAHCPRDPSLVPWRDTHKQSPAGAAPAALPKKERRLQEPRASRSKPTWGPSQSAS